METQKIVGILVAIIIVIVSTWVAFSTFGVMRQGTDEAIEEYANQRMDVFGLCSEWLKDGALTKAYTGQKGSFMGGDSLGLTLHSKVAQFGNKELCPTPRENMDSSELFDCRVMCVMAAKAEIECEEDPTFYDEVDAFGLPTYISTPVAQTGTLSDIVKQSQCRGRVIQILMSEDHAGLSTIHDCMLGRTTGCTCENWKGREC